MSNNRTEIRSLAYVDNSECQRIDGKLQITLTGRNSAGNSMKFKITMEWWILPYLIREITKAWIEERTNRLRCLATMNNALPDSGATIV